MAQQLKHIEIFFRVPATADHGTYLSSTRVFARSRTEALAIVAARNPEYIELH